MRLERAITPGVTIADQPTEADLDRLKSEGYSGVVNLRHDGEPDQPMSVGDEGKKVEGLGMNYLNVGVGSSPLTDSSVGPFLQFLKDNDKVLVHCRKGGRAAAMVLLAQAQENGWSPAEAIARGRDMGLEVDGGLRSIVEDYLDTHRTVDGVREDGQ